MPRAKIVCTIGPCSDSPELLEKLVRGGMDVARLNFSHGTHEDHACRIRAIREIAASAGCPVAILQDLAGIKLRLGEFGEFTTFPVDITYICTPIRPYIIARTPIA